MAQLKSPEIKTEALNEFITEHGSTKKLCDFSPQELSIFSERVGVERALLALKESSSPSLDTSQKPIANAEATTSGTAATLKGATASGAIQGAISGTAQGLVKVGVNIVNGDITTVGAAAAKVGQSIVTTTVKSSGTELAKTALIAAGNTLAPDLTQQILRQAPVIKEACMVYAIAKGTSSSVKRLWKSDRVQKVWKRFTGGDDDGKGGGAMRLPPRQPIPKNISSNNQRQTSGSGTPTPPEDPDKDPEWRKLIRKSVEWIFRDKNKVDHIFPKNDKHQFNQFVDRFGSQETVVEKILEQISKNPDLPKQGVFKNMVIDLAGQAVTVTGVIMDGIIKIGSAWIE